MALYYIDNDNDNSDIIMIITLTLALTLIMCLIVINYNYEYYIYVRKYMYMYIRTHIDRLPDRRPEEGPHDRHGATRLLPRDAGGGQAGRPASWQAAMLHYMIYNIIVYYIT